MLFGRFVIPSKYRSWASACCSLVNVNLRLVVDKHIFTCFIFRQPLESFYPALCDQPSLGTPSVFQSGAERFGRVDRSYHLLQSGFSVGGCECEGEVSQPARPIRHLRHGQVNHDRGSESCGHPWLMAEISGKLSNLCLHQYNAECRLCIRRVDFFTFTRYFKRDILIRLLDFSKVGVFETQ